MLQGWKNNKPFLQKVKPADCSSFLKSRLPVTWGGNTINHASNSHACQKCLSVSCWKSTKTSFQQHNNEVAVEALRTACSDCKCRADDNICSSVRSLNLLIGHARDPDWLATVTNCYQDLATAIHWEEEAPLILNTLAMTPKRIQPDKS